jgi:hypothetical protein
MRKVPKSRREFLLGLVAGSLLIAIGYPFAITRADCPALIDPSQGPIGWAVSSTVSLLSLGRIPEVDSQARSQIKLQRP